MFFLNVSRNPHPPRRLAGAIVAVLALSLPFLLPGRVVGPPGQGAEGSRRAGATDIASFGVLMVRVTAKGSPVVGATVRLEMPGPHHTRITGVVRTGPHGHGRIDRLPDGRAQVTVDKPGLARARTTIEIRKGRARAVVRLNPGARLAGTVVDSDARPIPGAEVEVREHGASAPPWQTTAGKDGSFTFDTLVEGPVRLDASARGYETATRQAVATTRGGRPLEVRLRRTGGIAGRVLGPDGQPAEGADVVLAGSGIWPARRVSSDTHGRFSVQGVPGGVYEVRARRGDLVAAPREGLVLAPGGSATLTFHLAPGVRLRGTVVDAADGAPVSGAQVRVAEDALAFMPRAVRTRADGSFRVGGLRPTPHRVAVHADGYVAIDAQEVQPGGPPVHLEMRRGAVLAGHVVDEHGVPVAGARIEVVGTSEAGAPITVTGPQADFQQALFAAQASGPSLVDSGGELGVTLGAVPPLPLVPPASDGSGGTARGLPPAATSATPMPSTPASGGFVSDTDGGFRLTDVPPGRLQLVARAGGHAPGQTRPLLVLSGSTRDDLTIVLSTGGTIDGRVVDGRGSPVSFVPVELRTEDALGPRMAFAGRDGTFTFDGALGIVTLTARPAGRPGARVRATVAPGQRTEVELALEDTLVTLDGRTVDTQGFPVTGVRLTIRSLRAETPVERTALSGDDGTFEVGGLPSPPFRIEADHPDYAPTEVRRVASVAREVRIQMALGAEVAGQVLDDWDGSALADAKIELRDDDAVVGRTRTDDEGKFELPRIPAGDYTVVASRDGYVSGEAHARLRASRWGLGDLTLDPLRLAPGGGVRGDVVDALGDPVPGAEVAWGDPPDWTHAVRTDPRGRFRLDGIPPGEVQVTARHPAAGQASLPAPVRVFAKEQSPGLRLHLPERFDAARADLGPGPRTGVAATVQREGNRVRMRLGHARLGRRAGGASDRGRAPGCRRGTRAGGGPGAGHAPGAGGHPSGPRHPTRDPHPPAPRPPGALGPAPRLTAPTPRQNRAQRVRHRPRKPPNREKNARILVNRPAPPRRVAMLRPTRTRAGV